MLRQRAAHHCVGVHVVGGAAVPTKQDRSPCPRARRPSRYDQYLQSNLRQRTQLDPKGRPPTTTVSLWTIGRVQARDEATGVVKVEVTAEAGPHPRGKLLDLKAEDTNVCVIASLKLMPAAAR